MPRSAYVDPCLPVRSRLGTAQPPQCNLHPALENQILSDLKPYAVITAELVNEAFAFCQLAELDGCFRVQIRNNAVFIIGERTDGPENRNREVQMMLLRLVERLRVPDVDLVLSTADLVAPYWHDPPPATLPYLATCRAVNTQPILYPDFSYLSWSDVFISHYDDVLADIRAMRKMVPWEKRNNRAFFRGGPQGEVRPRLHELAKMQPDQIDFEYVNVKRNRHTNQKGDVGPPGHLRVTNPAKFIPVHETCQWKYQFYVPGVACSARLKYQLACGSLVIYTQNDFEDILTPLLKDGETMLETSDKFKELPTLLQWIREHDTEVQQIAENGARAVEEHLSGDDALCYWQRLLVEYAARMTFTVTPHPMSVRVEDAMMRSQCDHWSC
eukprot:TRINITY_DN3345_c0_g1_i1.p1 TRINITY_DN3345_c0_g1~~TRINITY_DN3345_c0_g1_i1.p1  ORF type:complete len:385 (-),score=71.31 TRINITY_DN3345_c0_g1_i1:25-1179(-)